MLKKFSLDKQTTTTLTSVVLETKYYFVVSIIFCLALISYYTIFTPPPPQLKKLYETPHTQLDTWQTSETVRIAYNINFAIILLAKQGKGGDERHIAIDDISFANQCGFGKDDN